MGGGGTHIPVPRLDDFISEGEAAEKAASYERYREALKQLPEDAIALYAERERKLLEERGAHSKFISSLRAALRFDPIFNKQRMVLIAQILVERGSQDSGHDHERRDAVGDEDGDRGADPAP